MDRHGEVGHGSTSASCAIVRRFYSHPSMIALAQEGALTYGSWGEFIGPIDEELAEFCQVGVLMIPPQMDAATLAIVDEMRAVGVLASVMTADEVIDRFGCLSVASFYPTRPADDSAFFDETGREIAGAIFEADGGYVRSPGLATHNLRLAAEREGARFRLNQEVVAIHAGVGGAGSARFGVVLAAGEPLEADVVVNVAGPHSGVINTMAGATLPLQTRPLRREVHVLPNPIHRAESGAGFPVVGDIDGGIYFKPEGDGRQVSVGSTEPDCDELEWVSDPDDYRTTISERYRERQCMRLMKRFPAVRLGPRRGVAALYDVTVRDWYPIADKTNIPGFYVCIGTSGSSFKTAPILGQLMAHLITAGESGRDTDRDPLRLPLPHLGREIDASFLSRLRGEIQSSGTVIG